MTREGQELAPEGWALVRWGWVSPRLRGSCGKGAEGGGNPAASFNSEGKEEKAVCGLAMPREEKAPGWGCPCSLMPFVRAEASSSHKS